MIRKQKPEVLGRRQFVSSTRLAFRDNLRIHRATGSRAGKPTSVGAFICELFWRERDKTVKPTPG
jgi:hypothetical protein